MRIQLDLLSLSLLQLPNCTKASSRVYHFALFPPWGTAFQAPRFGTSAGHGYATRLGIVAAVTSQSTQYFLNLITAVQHPIVQAMARLALGHLSDSFT